MYFCSEHCAHRFTANPDRYLRAGPGGDDGVGDHPPGGGGVDLDPVCGMTVEPGRAPAQVQHRGQTVSFCGPGCADRFRADPDRYLPARAGDPVGK
jgi:YHS domain-containing protein